MNRKRLLATAAFILAMAIPVTSVWADSPTVGLGIGSSVTGSNGVSVDLPVGDGGSDLSASMGSDSSDSYATVDVLSSSDGTPEVSGIVSSEAQGGVSADPIGAADGTSEAIVDGDAREAGSAYGQVDVLTSGDGKPEAIANADSSNGSGFASVDPLTSADGKPEASANAGSSNGSGNASVDILSAADGTPEISSQNNSEMGTSGGLTVDVLSAADGNPDASANVDSPSAGSSTNIDIIGSGANPSDVPGASQNGGGQPSLNQTGATGSVPSSPGNSRAATSGSSAGGTTVAGRQVELGPVLNAALPRLGEPVIDATIVALLAMAGLGLWLRLKARKSS